MPRITFSVCVCCVYVCISPHFFRPRLSTTLNAFFFFFAQLYSPAYGQTVVTGVVPSSLRFLPSIFIAHRVQQSHCSSIFHRVLLTHALAFFSTSQFVRNKNSPRIYTSLHSGRFELTKLTYTRLEDNLIRHRGDRLNVHGTKASPDGTSAHTNARQ